MRTPKLLLCALLPPLSIAGSTALATACEPAGDAAAAPALDAALATFDLQQIRADVEWIAADERAGRDTPSEGLEATARYIATQLEALGFAPGARDGYLHHYPLSWRQLDAEASRLNVQRGDDSVRLSFGAEYMLGRLSDTLDLQATGECVSIGEGSRSDFKKANLEGKWAWCWDDGSSTRRAASRAQEGGAIGVIFTPGADYDRDVYAERFSGATRFVLRGSLGKSAPDRERPDEIPSVFLTQTAARRVLELAGVGGERELPAGKPIPVRVSENRRMTHPGGYRLFENVAGLWPGSDPTLRDEVVVLSAHYDHVGARGDEIYNGADDNASGTAGLLAVARALRAYGPMRRSVLLLWVSGEEKGLLGSRGWTNRPWLPEGMYPIANINIDMIGRNDPKKLLITPSKRLKAEYNGIVKLAEALAPEEGFDGLGSADEYWRRSDHMNFAEYLDLPVAFLFADVHEDYHKPTDTPDKIDYDKVARSSRLLLRMLDGLQADDTALHKKDVPGADEFGARVRRGTALTDLEVLDAGLARFELEHGRLPEDLQSLIQEDCLQVGWSEIPRDPWGRDYVYAPRETTSEPVRLTSYGADGQPGGREEAEDVVLER